MRARGHTLAGVAIRIPTPALVVLVGPPASGKSTWAADHFRADHVVSSDAIRALVGEGEHDQRASADAFAVLDTVLERRMRRGLLTVVDTLGTDGKRRARWIELARARGVRTIAVLFDTPPEECRRRNKERGQTVPPAILNQFLRTWPGLRDSITDDGFDAVVAADNVELVPATMTDAALYSTRQREQPVTLEFALQIPRFAWPEGPAQTRDRLREIAAVAEQTGFTGIWVMDHFLQIPQVGREWEDMLESYTTLAFLAGVTERVRLGTLVTGITYRNIAHLAKIIATLDVLSGGRVSCGVGAAWFEREHKAYGWTFPSVKARFALLEDALQLLPLMWGPGSPSFEGSAISVAEAICYPRPLQEHIPLLVGGSGERRTLRVVAQYADACNLFGDATNVARKVEVLHKHCSAVGRDPSEITVTHLATTLVRGTTDELREAVESLKPNRATPESYAAAVNAGTVDDQIGRFRQLAEAGVQTAFVNFPDLSDAGPLERFAPVIDAFRG
jgi:F420-dependent oxidoreductase-like protein